MRRITINENEPLMHMRVLCSKKNPNAIKDYNTIIKCIHDGVLCEVDEDDAKLTAVPLVIIKTKGNGSWKTFHGYEVAYGDINRVADKVSEVYVYKDPKNWKDGYPTRVFNKTHRIMLMCDVENLLKVQKGE